MPINGNHSETAAKLGVKTLHPHSHTFCSNTIVISGSECERDDTHTHLHKHTRSSSCQDLIETFSSFLSVPLCGGVVALVSLLISLSSAPSELMLCEELHAVLHLVLQAGNILNAVSQANFPFYLVV